MYLFMEQSMVQAMVQYFDIVLYESMTVTEYVHSLLHLSHSIYLI